MLDVLSELSRVRTNIHLVLVGEGRQRPELESRIRRLSLGRMVTLAGYRQDAAQLYKAFDVMLIPSRSEGLGLVLQEAVMADVPVVASDLPVFVEQLGVKGIYVSPNDVSGWVTAIEHVLDSDRRSLAVEQGNHLASEQAWKRFRKSYVELLADDSGTVSASQNCENGKAF
ncbi:glycosyltransferase family 4 protein [Stutzerimonas kunmingensis]|nr:glycosyltransferase family 4 protein [Stutzerimonas kunmingensis]